MEYIVKHCPKCNGELHVPADLKTCICMFCGETFNLQVKEDIMPESLQMVEEEYQKALGKVETLTKNYDQYMDKFRRNSYSSSFEEYARAGAAVLSPAERYSSLSEENKAKVEKEVTQAFLYAITQNVTENTKGGLNKLNKSAAFDQCRFFLAVYTVPMIRSLNYSFSESVAGNIVERWNHQYPKYTFQKAEFSEIQQGFDKKNWCFITTAVCERQNKEDGCFELTAFRSFRDSYMLQSEAGKKLVEEYYQIAPAIVTFINMQPDSGERYDAIWNGYLNPCLKDIEEKNYNNCEKRYVRMVQNLKKEYHIQF